MSSDNQLIEIYSKAFVLIVRDSSPTSSDEASPGQIWCDVSTECAFICVVENSGYYYWVKIAE